MAYSTIMETRCTSVIFRDPSTTILKELISFALSVLLPTTTPAKQLTIIL